ncbi:cellulase family glycosylhydrolase [Treponema sp. TIM-1]|uniref:glycoside hydrolase family 5 protein n=1 Tax=Treponema sp. TIM-1 TaxID=2898417 RepID=UPI00397F2E74
MHIAGNRITDDQGRTLLLRGCNLGGSSKYPLHPDGQSWRSESLANPSGVSFVGRPFPEEEAPAHFDRLRRWGLTFIRFIITWEALEHEGPGIYDEAYLAYLRKILLIAEQKGISVFMDPHQDVWSRWTGGDGAPAWTMEKLGVNLDHLDAVGAALTQQNYHRFNHGPYPRMIWPVNYNRYAAATMFTLFFAGNTYAPGVKVAGEPVQDWLQERYFAALRHCYRRLKHCKAIEGWGTMNEPHQGFIGYRDCGGLENCVTKAGPMPSPFAAMSAASGHPVRVPVYTMDLMGIRVKGHQTLNPEGLSLFTEGFTCPWKQAGVWTDEGGEPRLLRKDHFAFYQGRPALFAEDFLKPFMNRLINRLREVQEKTIFFVEGVPTGEQPTWKAEDPSTVVHGFHWYDGITLYTKSFRPWFTLRLDTGKPLWGRKNVAAYFSEQLGRGVNWTRDHMENIPCLLGEFGLPFDMNHQRAFKTRNYRSHEDALSMYYDAIDAHLLHSTIWNYTADNTHEWGDGWNNEDLSIYHHGEGRAMEGWLRPYPLATAGIPRFLSWDRKKRLLIYRFMADAAISAPTEIYIPREYFGSKPEITAATSRIGVEEPIQTEYHAEARRLLVFHGAYGGEVEIRVRGDTARPS